MRRHRANGLVLAAHTHCAQRKGCRSPSSTSPGVAPEPSQSSAARKAASASGWFTILQVARIRWSRECNSDSSSASRVSASSAEAAASSSEQLREQTAELWMLQQALRAELQRRPDAETVDALLSRKLDRAGGEVAAHATSHMPPVHMHISHAFYDACTRTHNCLSTPGEAARARGHRTLLGSCVRLQRIPALRPESCAIPRILFTGPSV